MHKVSMMAGQTGSTLLLWSSRNQLNVLHCVALVVVCCCWMIMVLLLLLPPFMVLLPMCVFYLEEEQFSIT